MIFKDVGLACVDDPRLFNARIPGSNALFPSTIVAPARGPNGEFVNCLSFDHPDGNLPRISRCLFAHQHDELVRVRYFNFATYFHRSTPWRSVLSMLNEERAFDRFSGVLTAPEHLSGVLRATTAASSISTEGLLEPTITSLLNEDEFIRKAFGAVRAWSQPELQWVAGAPSDHRSIRPDFILQRIDGRLDIVDFKLPMLERRRVTVRGPSRRGFISPVSEGISQLANYEEFFSHAENRRRAEATLGVSVDSDVSLTLVVGTSENTVSTHLREASRPLKLNIQVLDYDSLVNLFLAGEVVAARAS